MNTSKKAKSKSVLKVSFQKEHYVLHDFFTQAPALLAILKGPDHVFEFANPAYMELTGNRNLIGKMLLEAVPEIAGQGFIELLDNVYNTGETFTGKEMPVMVDKGTGKLEQFYLNFTYQAFINDKDEIEGILVFAYDVSEQVNARKQIEASEKRFSNILSQSLMAIAILKGPEMTVAFANEPMIAMMGKGKDIIGKSLIEVMPGIKDQVFSKLLSNVYATGVAFATDEIKSIINRNGKYEECYFNLVYQPYRDVDDTVTGITVLATEITEYVLAKKQIEESEKEQKKLASHLKLATDSAQIGIWSLDMVSSKLEWSNMHKKMWGYDENREDLTYEDWHQAIVPGDKELAFQKIEESRVNHGVYDVDYRINRANDSAIVWVKSTGQYQYDEFGEAHKLTSISLDITEQKSFDKELMEAKVFAEMASLLAEEEKAKA